MELLGDVGRVESFFWGRLEVVPASVQDSCMVCTNCTIGSEIVLDAPDGTPRLHGSCRILFRSIWRQCYCQCEIGARFMLTVP